MPCAAVRAAAARMRPVYLTLGLLSLLLVTWTASAQVVGQDCLMQQACFPWSYEGTPSVSPCRRGRRLNLRFLTDVATENVKVFNGETVSQAVYAFCPVVDRFQSFSLWEAPFLAGAYKVTDGNTTYNNITTSLSVRYLSVYGFGNTNNTLFPERGASAGSVVLAVNGSMICNTPRSFAVVSTLVLDIGLHNGRFNYASATAGGGTQSVVNPNYNNETCWQQKQNATLASVFSASSSSSSSSLSTSVDYCNETIEVPIAPDAIQPLKTGFVPTCAVDSDGGDYCLFDEYQVCIGNPGQKNCARCYNAANLDALAQATVQVWTSYYGTDSRGYALRSGGVNPISQHRFASSGVLSKFTSAVNKAV